MGDYVTYSTLPSFVGTITEPNTALVPLNGQTAIVDIGIDVGNGTTSTSPTRRTSRATCCRTSARTPARRSPTPTATSRSPWAWTGPAPGWSPTPTRCSTRRTTSAPAASSCRCPARSTATTWPGPGSSTRAATSRIPTDPNAQAPFVVDTVDPTVTVTSPVANSVISSSTGAVQLRRRHQREHGSDSLHHESDPASPVGPQRQLHRNRRHHHRHRLERSPSSISTPGTGGTGQGADRLQHAQRRWPTACTSSPWSARRPTTASATSPATSPASGDVVMTFAVFDPNNVTGVFVGGANYVTDPTLPQGDRANPFPTITAALAAASVGDRLEVLPGVYTENVMLQPLVSHRLGRRLQHRHQLRARQRPGDRHPLSGDIAREQRPSPCRRPIWPLTPTPRPGSCSRRPADRPDHRLVAGGRPCPWPDQPRLDRPAGHRLQRSWSTRTTSSTRGPESRSPPPARAPRRRALINDAVIGNINGIVISDGGSGSATATTNIINDTIAFNTNGLVALNNSTTSSRAGLHRQQHLLAKPRPDGRPLGLGIISQTLEQAGPEQQHVLGQRGQRHQQRLRRGQHRQRVQPDPPGTACLQRGGQPGQLHRLAGLRRTSRPAARRRRSGHLPPRRQLRPASVVGRDQQRPGERGDQDRPPGQPGESQPDHLGLPSARLWPPRRRCVRVRADRHLGHHVGRRHLPRGHDLAGRQRGQPGQRRRRSTSTRPRIRSSSTSPSR